MKTKQKNKELKFIFLVVIQILLLLNAIVAESYFIDETNSFDRNVITENQKISSSKLAGFLSWVFVIKEIGMVSAQGEEFNCCARTNNGAICQNIPSNFDSSSPDSCANPLPTSCQETSICEIGTCVFNEGEICSANSPREECENEGGVFTQQEINEVLSCIKGACVVGSEIQFTTKKQCELLSTSAGLEIDFREGLTELDFSDIGRNLKKGSCVLQGGNCRFGTWSECESMDGKFYENYLCTNLNLETSCEPSEETTCFDDKVYFTDSCGNLANVYDSSKVNPETNQEYWDKVSNPECVVDVEDSKTIKSCGNCNVFSSTQCSESESGEETDYGNYFCKDLRCIDEEGNERKNGEKWCVYDSYIGDGKDPAGSEHWLASCNNGDLEVDLCGNARGQICAQHVIEESGISFSTASCVVNEALQCIEYNEDSLGNCEDNSQCQIKNIDVGSYFKFDICVPQYPRGFDLKEGNEIDGTLCSLANQECTVVYQKKIKGWRCIENCNCETQDFAKQMNDLCVSLGDCGSYINFVGEGTNNIDVKNSPEVSWRDYKNYSKPVPGKVVNLSEQRIPTFVGEKNIEGFTPEGPNQLVSSLGASGLGYVAYVIKAGGIGMVSASNIMAWWGANWVAVGVAAAGAVIGALAGKYLAESFGISGNAATVLVTASAVAGAVIAKVIIFGSKLTGTFAGLSVLGWTLVIAVVVIIIIILSGWGTTKEKKVEFTCMAWQAPSGGKDCEKCNEDPLKSCTKYRCESLGQACKLINEDTEKPRCESLSYESTPPKITPGEVKTLDHDFQDEEPKKVSVRQTNGQCIQEFVPVVFTLETDEYAQCKWDFEKTADYESMSNFPAEGTTYSLNHTFIIGGLSLGLLEAYDITGDLIEGFTGDINLYIKCQDYFGNFNFNDYVVNFCVNSGPDLTPVLHSLTQTSPENNKVLKYGTNKTNFTMYVNEPAECKYSLTEDKKYEEMENTFNCKTNLTERDLFGWPCSTTLENLESENKFYIKCKDQPWLEKNESEKRNTNSEDFVYNLSVSENNLKIDSIFVSYNDANFEVSGENSTIIKGGKNSFTLTLEVETSKGVDNGISACSYQWNNNSILFLNTHLNSHSQKLTLANGNYNIPIKCVDEIGNKITKNAKFTLDVDNDIPMIVRTYHQSGKLRLITNEQAKCYSSSDNLKQCNFNIEDVEDMETRFSTLHSTDWTVGKTYYIKCEDAWDNQNSGCAVKIIASS